MRNKQFYGLFEVNEINGKKSYTRLCPESAYHKDVAIRIFQNALLAPYLGGALRLRELRVVKDGSQIIEETMRNAG